MLHCSEQNLERPPNKTTREMFRRAFVPRGQTSTEYKQRATLSSTDINCFLRQKRDVSLFLCKPFFSLGPTLSPQVSLHPKRPTLSTADRTQKHMFEESNPSYIPAHVRKREA